ncbi:MAG: hypothetical protein U0169_07115 [Polyangiaceae bacterium]
MHRTYGRPSRKRSAFAVSVFVSVLGALVACGSDPTGITFVPSSLVRWESGVRVTIRVFRPSGALVFCRSYTVDEASSPGETISLLDHESSLALAPGSTRDETVRVVSEVFPAGTADVCEGSTTVPIARTVGILRYVEGSTLRLRSVFDASCLGVLSCDPLSETCSHGTCVGADVATRSGKVDEACFDLRACPELARLAPTSDPCAFAIPVDPTRGYVAVTLRLDLEDVPEGPLRAAAILTESDVASPSPGIVVLGERMCDLRKTGVVEDVYFGYACSAPAPSATLCPLSVADDAPNLGDVLGGRTTSDASVPRDGTVPPDASGDATEEFRDSPVLPTDGSVDSSSDRAATDAADGSASDGGDGDAADSGGTTGGDGGPVGVHRLSCGPSIQCDLDTVPPTGCCVAPSAPPACTSNRGSCTGSMFMCDDVQDCQATEEYVCCATEDSANPGPYLGSLCSTTDLCTVRFKHPLCSRDHRDCPPGKTCSGRAADGPVASVCEDQPVPSVACGVSNCVADSSRCCSQFATPVCQQVGSCPLDEISCDDAADCSSAGPVCCLTDFAGHVTSACSSGCTGSQEVLCSDDNESCPRGMVCAPPTSRPYGRRTCRPNP